ncbi:motility protein A [Nocardioides yefusunii]|uniref:Motility protein A n=1 Tax=Nocardioides yefusunii TaxID=2500546 RepID=A0ABW1QX48_9ACTN|nr:MotA/TolQ/ExbB proton channel family protein [Nocardioides yefusunii]
MDPATLIGIIVAFVVIVVANMMEGGTPTAIFMLPPMLLVFGATFAVSIAGGTMGDAKNIFGSLKRALTGKAASSADLIPVCVTLAERARREGLLALENELREINDPFLVKGMTMAIDGTDPEEVREILEAEVHAKRLSDRQKAKFFADAGAYAPTIGIVGTVMGLVHVLESLAEPEKLGHLIAGAFLATLWGVFSANLMWLPISSRLKRLSELEATRMEIAIEGIAAVQAGANPRVVSQKLTSLLPPGQQPEAA